MAQSEKPDAEYSLHSTASKSLFLDFPTSFTRVRYLTGSMSATIATIPTVQIQIISLPGLKKTIFEMLNARDECVTESVKVRRN